MRPWLIVADAGDVDLICANCLFFECFVDSVAAAVANVVQPKRRERERKYVGACV